MIGAALLVIALVVVLPLAFFALGVVVSMLASITLTAEGEASHEGSELIATNR